MQEYGKRVEERGGLYLGVLDKRWPARLVSFGLKLRTHLSSHIGDDYGTFNSRERGICEEIDALTLWMRGVLISNTSGQILKDRGDLTPTLRLASTGLAKCV